MKARKRQPEFFFAVALRRVRHEAELTQEELADKIEMHASEVSAIESGKRSPHLKTMKRLTDGLGLPFWEVARLAAELEAGVAWNKVAWPPAS